MQKPCSKTYFHAYSVFVETISVFSGAVDLYHVILRHIPYLIDINGVNYILKCHTPSSASPQRAMKCLSHSRLQYVFIDSRVRTQALCACLCESVCVCVGVSNSHCLKLQGPESDDSPQLLDAATRRADVTCPETKSYCSYWPLSDPG